MRASKQLVVLVAVSIAAVALTAPAQAKTKRHPVMANLTLQEAWAICKKFTDEGVWSWDQHGQRLQRGGSCMLRYGFRFGDYPD